jgi:hypothetical protein
MGFTRDRASSILAEQMANVYVGLSTATPNENGVGFAEPSASNGYERAEFGSDGMTTEIKAQIANKKIIFFNESIEGGYGTVTHFGLFSSKKGGTPFFTGELNAPMTIPAGYVPIFRAYKLKIGLDKDYLENYENET